MTDSDFEFWMHLEMAVAKLNALRSYSGKSLGVLDKERIEDELEAIEKSINSAQVLLE